MFYRGHWAQTSSHAPTSTYKTVQALDPKESAWLRGESWVTEDQPASAPQALLPNTLCLALCLDSQAGCAPAEPCLPREAVP